MSANPDPDPRIRTATPGDGAGVAAVYAPEVTDGVASFETHPPSTHEMSGRIARVLPVHPWLVLEEDGRIAGFAYAAPHRDRAAYRWSVDTTVYVGREHQGRGFGRALYGVLLDTLVRQGFHAAYAGVTLPNPASEALHRSLGFETIGIYPEVGFKHDAWRDTAWMRRVLTPASGQPAEPIPFRLLDAGA